MAAAAAELGLPAVHPDADLWDLGLDDAGAERLAMTLTAAGWPALHAVDVRRCRSAAGLTAKRPRDRTLASSTVTLNGAGPRPPVFAVPGSGGTALAFWWLAHELGWEQPLIVCEPHALRSRGWADTTVERAARRVVDAVTSLQPEGTVVLLAYSAGGMVAIEAARQLIAAGRAPHIVLLDCTIGDTAGRGIAPPPTDLRTRARRAVMQAWLRVLPARTVPTTLRFRAYFHLGVSARRRYGDRPVSCPITLLHPVDSVYAGGWADVTDDRRTVPGDHYSMIEPPAVSVVARQLEHIVGS